MFWSNSKSKQKIVDDKVEELKNTSDNHALSKSLEENVNVLKKLFEDNDTLVTRNIQNCYDSSLKYCIVYCDGVISSTTTNENIIKPLILSQVSRQDGNFIETLMSQVLQVNEAKKTDKIEEIIKSITYGDTILFADGAAEAIILNSKGFQTRSIAEPDNEKILSGPREGFTEALLMNLSMIRRKMRTNELKMKYMTLGARTNTQICVCYVENIVNKNILKELYKRLKKIDMDAVLDSNYLTELLRDNPLSPFRTTGYTERPDVVVGKLLEGRIAVFIDGTPVVMTLPYLFIENFQSNEDYYLNYYYTSFARILRIIGFLLTITVPGLYIAVGAFHHEMLPTTLLVNIAAERASVPLPAAIEAFIMLIIFDILRETGIRMPSNVGQALSIVGALVIGQAAVAAKLVAAPMIIVIATTGITSLLIPKMNAPIIFVRAMLLLLSSILGFFGLILGLSSVLIHILNLRSFGVSTTTLSGDIKYQEVKDIIVRAPWWKMITRPPQTATDKVRMKFNNGDNYE